jgi:hypothetical protein
VSKTDLISGPSADGRLVITQWPLPSSAGAHRSIRSVSVPVALSTK